MLRQLEDLQERVGYESCQGGETFSADAPTPVCKKWELIAREQANPQYLSVNWEASGGGSFAVIPLNEKGRLPEHIPLFRGHKAVVLDTDWNPFNDSLIASGSDDGKVCLWTVPKGFTLYTEDEEPRDVFPVARLTGHSRKVGHVLFNPAAENVLATASGDYSIKLWDVEKASANLALKHGDIVQGLSWSADGSLLVTTCRDKKLRIWDARQERPAHEVPGHSGAKNSRVVWMGEHDRIATTGFSKMSDRQLGLWDIRDPKEPIGGFQVLDSISGVCMPFWDEGTQCLYLAGKGDGNIRYFEFENDKFQFLSEYKSGEPQRGIAFLPKRGVNTHENEVMRAFKTVNDAYIEPVSFIVPRRAEVFQGDIYPPTTGSQPGVTGPEWFGGKAALPPKMDLESVYDGEEPVVVPATQKPATSTSSRAPASPAKKGPDPSQTTAAPPPNSNAGASASTSAQRQAGPPASMKQSENSISNLASKFADDNNADEESSSDDEGPEPSSFDEPPSARDRALASGARDTQRATSARASQSQTQTPTQIETPLSPTKHSSNTSSTAPISSPTNSSSPVATTAAPPPPSTSTSSQPTSSSQQQQQQQPQQPQQPQQNETVPASVLFEIKTLLEEQNRTISRQSERIEQLTGEVGGLKARLGD
ncbi:MAG: Coronin-like protein crn1 [Sclerophora amabilis]|nr:MAG: Coronin-like protein crn1 [Sclerophora amabilis]